MSAGLIWLSLAFWWVLLGMAATAYRERGATLVCLALGIVCGLVGVHQAVAG